MPNRKQKDCSKGKIYFIRSNNPEIKSKYVGSTIQTLAARMRGHRSGYKRWLDGKIASCAIFYEFQKYGIEQFHIELIEDYPCEREEQLLARENFFIRQEDCVNKHLAFTTHEEKKANCKQYYQEHKEELAIKSKQHRQEHKEEYKARDKQHHQEHKEENNARDKQYYQEHREELIIKKKQHRDKNNELITCVCGCQIKKQSIWSHYKSNRHKAFIADSI